LVTVLALQFRMSSLGVVGMGMLGRQIAEAGVLSGFDVILCKATFGDPQHGLQLIERSLDRAVSRGKLEAGLRDAALGRLFCTSELDALSRTDFVIESVIEDLHEKRALFAAIEPRVAPDAVLASNTSSLSLERISSALLRPARFVGLHFFSPVPAMKLVEIAAPATTSSATVRAATELASALGKTPIRLPDTPGFLVNRLLIPFLLDAIRMLERGVATAEQIDTAMRLGCGHPVGPLALADVIGLDVVLAIASTLHRETGEAHTQPPRLLIERVAAGQLGKKSGAGLHVYAS
jgi:3-hydroxybutyryl-CoA dehydrogenase